MMFLWLCPGLVIGFILGIAAMWFDPLWLEQTINLIRGSWD